MIGLSTGLKQLCQDPGGVNGGGRQGAGQVRAVLAGCSWLSQSRVSA
jgi:hypothetical protein